MLLKKVRKSLNVRKFGIGSKRNVRKFRKVRKFGVGSDEISSLNSKKTDLEKTKTKLEKDLTKLQRALSPSADAKTKTTVEANRPKFEKAVTELTRKLEKTNAELSNVSKTLQERVTKKATEIVASVNKATKRTSPKGSPKGTKKASPKGTKKASPRGSPSSKSQTIRAALVSAKKANDVSKFKESLRSAGYKAASKVAELFVNDDTLSEMIDLPRNKTTGKIVKSNLGTSFDAVSEKLFRSAKTGVRSRSKSKSSSSKSSGSPKDKRSPKGSPKGSPKAGPSKTGSPKPDLMAGFEKPPSKSASKEELLTWMASKMNEHMLREVLVCLQNNAKPSSPSKPVSPKSKSGSKSRSASPKGSPKTKKSAGIVIAKGPMTAAEKKREGKKPIKPRSLSSSSSEKVKVGEPSGIAGLPKPSTPKSRSNSSKKRSAAAKKIQRAFRKSKVASQKKRSSAAKKIQRAFRKAKSKSNKKRSSAAKKIQRTFRKSRKSKKSTSQKGLAGLPKPATPISGSGSNKDLFNPDEVLPIESLTTPRFQFGCGSCKKNKNAISKKLKYGNNINKNMGKLSYGAHVKKYGFGVTRKSTTTKARQFGLSLSHNGKARSVKNLFGAVRRAGSKKVTSRKYRTSKNKTSKTTNKISKRFGKKVKGRKFGSDNHAMFYGMSHALDGRNVDFSNKIGAGPVMKEHFMEESNAFGNGRVDLSKNYFY